MAPRNVRQFGIPPENFAPQFNAFARQQAAELPLPEMANLERQQRQEAERDAQERAVADAREQTAIDALWDRDFSFGAVAKPKSNTLRGYKLILRQGGGVRDLQFSGPDYGIFDSLIVKACGTDRGGKPLSAAFNADHPHYQDFAPLRRNLAILRNYLLVTMFPDGLDKRFEASNDGSEDAKNYAYIQEIANKLGEALAGTKPGLTARWIRSVKRLLRKEDLSQPEVSAFMQAANVPDKGIATMYEYIFGVQNGPPPFSMLYSDPIGFARRRRVNTWNLPDIEQTAFASTYMQKQSRGMALLGICDAFERVVNRLNTLDTVSSEDKRISVDHARRILENLRITVGNSEEEARISRIDDPKRREAQMLLQVGLAYKDAVGDIARENPALLKNAALEEANGVLRELIDRVQLETFLALSEEGNAEAAKELSKRMKPLADRYDTIALEDLVSKLNTGLNEADRIRNLLPSRAANLQKTPAIPGKQTAVEQAVGSGRDKYASGTISQVSDPRLVTPAQQANKKKSPGPNKDNPPGQSLGGGTK